MWTLIWRCKRILKQKGHQNFDWKFWKIDPRVWNVFCSYFVRYFFPHTSHGISASLCSRMCNERLALERNPFPHISQLEWNDQWNGVEVSGLNAVRFSRSSTMRLQMHPKMLVFLATEMAETSVSLGFDEISLFEFGPFLWMLRGFGFHFASENLRRNRWSKKWTTEPHVIVQDVSSKFKNDGHTTPLFNRNLPRLRHCFARLVYFIIRWHWLFLFNTFGRWITNVIITFAGIWWRRYKI